MLAQAARSNIVCILNDSDTSNDTSDDEGDDVDDTEESSSDDEENDPTNIKTNDFVDTNLYQIDPKDVYVSINGSNNQRKRKQEITGQEREYRRLNRGKKSA